MATNQSARHQLSPWLSALRKQLSRLVAGYLLLLVTLISSMVLLGASGWFITSAALAGAGLIVLADIFTPGAIIRLAALTRTVARYFERVTHHDVVLRVEQQWRVNLFQRLTQLKSVSLHKLRTATVLQRLTSDLSAMNDLYIRVLAPVTASLFLALAVSVLLLTLLGLPALFSVALLLLAWCIAGPVSIRASRTPAAAVHSEESALRYHTLNHLDGLAELTCWGLTDKHQEQILHSADTMNDFQDKRERRAMFCQSASQILFWASLGWLVFIAGPGFVESPEHGALLALAALTLLAVNEAILSLPEQCSHFGRVEASAQAVNETAAMETETADAEELNTSEAVVSLQQATVIRNHRTIVQPVDLELRQGEKAAITGASGSGKSTLVELCAGLQHATSGVVTGDCVSATKRSVLLQQSGVLAGSVRDNLLLGCREARGETADSGDTNSLIWDALEFVELDKVVKAMPEQFNTWLGAYGERLSGGQVRRLALARVWLHAHFNNSQFIVLDEPFTGLDMALIERLKPRMEQWFSDKTVLMCAHSKAALPVAERYYTIDGGKLGT